MTGSPVWYCGTVKQWPDPPNDWVPFEPYVPYVPMEVAPYTPPDPAKVERIFRALQNITKPGRVADPAPSMCPPIGAGQR